MKLERILGTAFAQSYLDGFEANHALDGKTETCWKAAPYYQWWLMDCGEIYHIDSISVSTGGAEDIFYRYAIDYSEDRINWRELCEKTDSEKPKVEGECYRAGVRARYLRITMTYCSQGDTVSLQNVVVMGIREALSVEKPRIEQARVRAVDCDAFEGFETVETDELEPGWVDRMLLCSRRQSYLKFSQVDMENPNVQQLRGMFVLPDKDRTLHVRLELHLDVPGGPLIGTMDISRQYTPWLQFACDLKMGFQGKRDIYLCVSFIESPQRLGILWLTFIKRPTLHDHIIDHADEVVPTAGKFQVFLGNMHSHTGFTDGMRTPAYAYDYARRVAGLQFLGVTEHSNLFDDPFDASKSRKWRDLKRISEEKTEPGVFLALMGSETTWYNQFGHMNIYGADFFLNPYEVKYNEVSNYYNILKCFPKVINQWNHPWSCGTRHLDLFEPYDPELDKIIYTIEINNLEDPQMDGLLYYIRALDLGWHVSPVGSQDNHKEDWGTANDIRTGIVARSLTKAHFYDAVRCHRTYYTNAKDLRVLYDVNGSIMGSEIKRWDILHFHITVENREQDAELERVDILTEGGRVVSSHLLTGHQAEVNVEVAEKGAYFFLKIFQRDGNFAATAPVWILN